MSRRIGQSEYGIGAINHDPNMPDPQRALTTLQKLVSFVTPILRQHKMKVGILNEFYPAEPGLLGLNVGAGMEICLRLRDNRNSALFLPYEHVLDTLLHEMSHNFRGPHDEVFHAKWNEFRAEAESLIMKGYTGEGFMGKGNVVGGRRNPAEEARLRRVAAAKAEEERRKQQQQRGHVLGGFGGLGGYHPHGGYGLQGVYSPSGEYGFSGGFGGYGDYYSYATPSSVAVAAAERRRDITKGCGDIKDKATAKSLENAKRNGFQTVAEEDEANSIAIAEALSELEYEAKQHSDAGWKSPHEIWHDGLSWTAEGGLAMAPPPTHDKAQARRPNSDSNASSRTKPPAAAARSSRPASTSHAGPSKTPTHRTRDGRPVSRLVLEDEERKHAKHARKQSSIPPPPVSPVWACEVCTLENPANYLACDACRTERSHESIMNSLASPAQPVPTFLPDPRASEEDWGWQCRFCGSFMEKEWWTCSMCGIMKDRS